MFEVIRNKDRPSGVSELSPLSNGRILVGGDGMLYEIRETPINIEILKQTLDELGGEDE